MTPQETKVRVFMPNDDKGSQVYMNLSQQEEQSSQPESTTERVLRRLQEIKNNPPEMDPAKRLELEEQIRRDLKNMGRGSRETVTVPYF